MGKRPGAKPLPALSDSDWASFVERHKKGESLGSIARSLGVSESYFCKAWKRRKLPTPDRAFIPGSRSGTVSAAPPPQAPSPLNTKQKRWEVR